MYYDIYNSKMIPAIFICMDNKTMEVYIFVFPYIKYYIHKILRNKEIKIKWDTITADKGLSLYTSFIYLCLMKIFVNISIYYVIFIIWIKPGNTYKVLDILITKKIRL